MTDAMTQAKYRRALVHDLRNLSPEWTWDFGTTKMSRRPCGCAIGRAAALGIIRTAHGVGVWKAMATKLGLSLDQVTTIFSGQRPDGTYFYGTLEVTPQMVADALDRN